MIVVNDDVEAEQVMLVKEWTGYAWFQFSMAVSDDVLTLYILTAFFSYNVHCVLTWRYLCLYYKNAE